MSIKHFKLIYVFIFVISLHSISAKSEILKNINIEGNQRIPDETIKMFANVKLDENISNERLNLILKRLYDSNFFENVSVSFDKNILKITVVESPIIDKVIFTGVKSNTMIENLRNIIKLKSRSSFNEYILSEDRDAIQEYLKNSGYYFADIQTYVEDIDNNLLNINYKIVLNNKAKIKKISFIGNTIYKDSKLRSLIVSEEYKFWKFISGRKYLNQQTINFDERLLKNFYLNKGYYDVEINTSFARLINEDEFELIYNINPKNKIFFNNFILNLPNDFSEDNFIKLKKLFLDNKGNPYSINTVNKILEEIDFITLSEEYKSINASVEESIMGDKLDISFIITETEKFFVERINIFGNNVTRESVIRNQLEIDEGDPYNEILQKKSENNLKGLNFFKNVKSEILDGKDNNSKIININVEEKPTGEIMAGAGAGTSGGTFIFGIKENNYLGKGLSVDANATVTSETFKGLFRVTNPNYNNSEKSLYTSLEAIEIDRLEKNGYKTNKTGFEIGTRFEYYDDFNLGFSTRSFYEKIDTDSTASTRQQSQEGNYWDTFIQFNFDYDKRNQKFKTDDGFRSNYSLDLPIISDTYTLTNTYNYKYYTSLYENNISSLSFFLQSANSISDKDVKLSERLFIPSSKLRGFERGKVGPKDGDDFIGGNFATSVNFNTTLPVIFENVQNLDATMFLDIANVWGVDYDSSINKSDQIRSSIGIGIDWFSVIGPINFSFTENISKANTDITESFRFNIGTTF
tara:strand:+ start:1075 stop:3324 length:2250 start_codon:yes stop_codon:yes gene_type:complete